MKAPIQTGTSECVSAPLEKRFLINRFSVQRVLIRPFLAGAAMTTLLLGLPAIGAHPGLDDYLERMDDRYNPETAMLSHVFGGGTGYHSTVEPGTTVHPTRSTMDYALGLLARGTEEDRERAARVVGAVLALQDTDPDRNTYGIWPYYLEESLDEMSPPDWNWADFIGMRIATALVRWPHHLEDSLKNELRAALGHAAEAIRRRDVRPGYTNIAVLGGGVCVVAGELLDDAELLRYGRNRLKRVVEHTDYHGSFNEYNSPTYTMVVLHETERILHLAEDEAAREAADALRRVAWQIISDSFHPATQQWAGPHSRWYSDRLRQEGLDRVMARVYPMTGPTLSLVDTHFVDAIPCPPEMRQRFDRLPEDPLVLERTFQRGSSRADSNIGVTWMTKQATLGSINRSVFWTQRRPLIGYWVTGEGGEDVAVLRSRFLKDGRDFSSVGIATNQEGPRTVSVLYTEGRRGDWHIHLDRPRDGIFPAEDLRWRWQLAAPDAEVRELGGGRYELRSGEWRAVLSTHPGVFDGREITWSTGAEEGLAYVDAVCHAGESRDFPFRDLGPVKVAVAMEVIRSDEAISKAPLRVESDGDTIRARWEREPVVDVTSPIHVP